MLERDGGGGVTSYTLTITATENNGGNPVNSNLVININDVNDESPSCASDTFTVIEPNGETGVHTVIDFMCTDADQGSTLTYTIQSGDSTTFAVTSGGILQIAVSNGSLSLVNYLLF